VGEALMRAQDIGAKVRELSRTVSHRGRATICRNEL
jgi:hypothetical protein